MTQESKMVNFMATKNGYYNNRLIFPNEFFYAPEKIEVFEVDSSGRAGKSKLVAFESVTSWVVKMSDKE
jgi:hypothetical protein